MPSVGVSGCEGPLAHWAAAPFSTDCQHQACEIPRALLMAVRGQLLVLIVTFTRVQEPPVPVSGKVCPEALVNRKNCPEHELHQVMG